ncbi:MAG: site-2 protease family protein [Verrucomicrobiae bacterium]|nr:site-2 protease family protein [Verrucomicrobiae bacterium]
MKRAGGILAAIGVVLAKFKALIFPLLKFLPVLLKTGGSMILMIAIYSWSYGWMFALGFVVLLFIHECGHLLAAKSFGLKVGAPVFIPFMGAFIALKEAPKNAWVEAVVGIGGPLLGSLGSLGAYLLYPLTGNPMFAALAYFGFFLNLFNLAPVTPLDGGRIVAALSPWLWLLGLAILLVAFFLWHSLIIILILAFSLPRVLSLFRQRTPEEVNYFQVPAARRWAMAFLYFGLAASLGVGMKLIEYDLHRHITTAPHVQ